MTLDTEGTEKDLAKIISKGYAGDLVSSKLSGTTDTIVSVKKLNNLLVKIVFNFNNREYSFRAMLSEQKEGILLLVQDRVAENFVLTGLSGFLYQKPNIHGGYVHRLNGFYFHIMLDYFDGDKQEFYFFGKSKNVKKDIHIDPGQFIHTAHF